MAKITGTAISHGLALGRARYIQRVGHQVPREKIAKKEIPEELKALQKGIDESFSELDEYLKEDDISAGEREILATHLDMLRDPEILGQLELAIREERCNAALATDQVFGRAIQNFKNMDSDIFAQKAADFEDLRNRLLKRLLQSDHDPLCGLDAETIPIFDEIHPSEVSLLKKRGVQAFLCKSSSHTAHAAILSRALSIGCVANIKNIRELVQEGELLIVDGQSGTVISNPGDQELEDYAQKLQNKIMLDQKQLRLRDIASKTKAGRAIDLQVNIGFPEEIAQVAELNAGGVGLFRTEFLFIGRDHLPTEEEQFAIYKELAVRIAPKPLTIRSFDIGGDKVSKLIPHPKEDNPYLGNRGIRFCLAHPKLMRGQMRAILRASAFGKVRVMFPMVIDVDDFLEAKRIFKSCADELYTEGVDYDPDIPLGSMVEIPSAALGSDDLARECDFLSIGTNDLVQYTLAVDRNNDAVARYFIQHHPAVLKLIRATATNASKHGIPVSICGEMAGIPAYVPLLIGMGISELSVNASAYYDVKELILSCDKKLDMIVDNFDFSTSISKVDKLIYRTLKPYHTKQESHQ